MKIADIIIKKTKGNLNEKEKSYFDYWIGQSKENSSLFERLQIILKNQGEKEFFRVMELNEEVAWEGILEVLKENKDKNKNKDKLALLFKYAAIIILALSLGISVWSYNQNTTGEFNSEDTITLQLSNGEVKVISAKTLQTLVDNDGSILGEQKGSELDYSVTSVTGELVYNELKVPYGKRFNIILSDGTKVFLNAGSSLKYPVKFIKGQNRQVFLTGEGYFDVHKDKIHPFIVSTEGMDVRVLGTRFNISAYPEDREINTVLVEGSVSLRGSNDRNEKSALLLEPGYKAEWDKFHEKISFEKVDTDVYTGWVEGKLILKEIQFKYIIKKLERHYKVEIKSDYSKLNSQVFTATFDIENINDVLNVFKEETPFEYQIINGDQIIISAPKQ